MPDHRICVLLLPLVLGAAEPAQWFVAPDGRDDGPGSQAKPFATLQRAQEAVRGRAPGTAARVTLAAGTWQLSTPLAFTAADGGTAAAPVVWRAAAPGTVHLVGGRTITAEQLAPLKDAALLARLPEEARGKVLAVSLERLGIALPALPTRTFIGNGDLPAIYQDGTLLPVARWPNGGFTTIKEVLDSGMEPKPHGGVFRFHDERPAAWTKAARDEGWWIEGYWRVPWVMEGVPVAAIDGAERTFTMAVPVSGGIGSKYSPLVQGTRKGDGRERYRVRNLIDELDQPGEWVLHLPTKTLCIWPLAGVAAPVTLVSGKDPALTVQKAAHLQFQGLDLSGGGAGAVRISGGEDVALLGCRIHATPGFGVDIQGGNGHVVQGCDVCDVGATPISVDGGERKTLTPGGHRIHNNHLHHFGLIARVVSGITVGGVGQQIRNNLIHDSPYGGITYTGNDHRIERNEIHNIGLEGGDLGGIYSGADWTSWGNVVSRNLIHHARTANGVYLDDGDSGDEVSGNIFYKLASGPFIGGGSHNWIHGNVVIDCKVGIHLDDRGVSRRYGAADSGQRRIAAHFDLTQGVWAERYPSLVSWFAQADLSLPTGNVLEGNTMIACPKGIDYRGSKANRQRFEIEDNHELAEDPGFRNPANLDFTVQAKPGVDLPAISVDGIGLEVDAWRPTLPTAEATGRYGLRKAALDFDSNTDVEKTNEGAKK